MVRYYALKCFYDVDKTIGTGGFAKVKLGTHLLTGEKVAIKILDKNLLGEDYPRVKMELEALKNISHHHICKLYQVIETPSNFFMVMEYCSGGELFDHIVEKSRLTEAEARSFFRQILSAVAYLHDQGYVHRDLKPENILLDKDLNLKLIDFGLCAKPRGGMLSHLETSCGSPTYAAPELIKGYKYLGSEVDVWSLGVLLYALMCGSLPFDCETIEGLFKKILTGKYDEPPWLSKQSRQVIKDMLQVDPQKRITINKLMLHPWMTMGYYEPLSLCTLHEYREKNDDVLEVMAAYYGTSIGEEWRKVSCWIYDYDTATYQLLLEKRRLNLPLTINTIGNRTRYRYKKSGIPLLPPKKSPLQDRHQSYAQVITNTEDDPYCDKLNVKEKENWITPLKPRKRSHATCSEDVVSPNKLNEKEKENWTTPSKIRKRSQVNGLGDTVSPMPPKITSRRRGEITGVPSSSPATPSTAIPGSRLLCSIEKRINQVRNAFTPKKKTTGQDRTDKLPTILMDKGLCNVSTTSYTNPYNVLMKLNTALQEKGIICKIKGFTLRGKIMEQRETSEMLKLTFELEVCMLKLSAESEAFVGIRRKRLKGDSWFYKNVCEQVLKLTNVS